MNCPKCGKEYNYRQDQGIQMSCNCFQTALEFYEYEVEKENYQKRIEYSNIPEEFLNKQFVKKPGNEIIYMAVQKYLFSLDSNIKSFKGMLLCGDIGIGKTFAECYIGIQIIRKFRRYVKYITVDEFVNRCNSFGNYNSDRIKYIESYSNCGILIIDDIGAAITEEWNKKYINELFDGRVNRNCITFMNSMYDKKNLEPRIGEKIVSRIFKMATGNIYISDSKIDLRKEV